MKKKIYVLPNITKWTELKTDLSYINLNMEKKLGDGFLIVFNSKKEFKKNYPNKEPFIFIKEPKK